MFDDERPLTLEMLAETLDRAIQLEAVNVSHNRKVMNNPSAMVAVGRMEAYTDVLEWLKLGQLPSIQPAEDARRFLEAEGC